MHGVQTIGWIEKKMYNIVATRSVFIVCIFAILQPAECLINTCNVLSGGTSNGGRISSISFRPHHHRLQRVSHLYMSTKGEEKEIVVENNEEEDLLAIASPVSNGVTGTNGANGKHEKSNKNTSRKRSVFKFIRQNHKKSKKSDHSVALSAIGDDQIHASDQIGQQIEQQRLVGDTSPSTIQNATQNTKIVANKHSDLVSMSDAANATLISAQEAVSEVSKELNRIINDSFDDLRSTNQNITEAIEEQVETLTEQTTLTANEIVETFAKAITELQDDQRKQLIYMQNNVEKKIVELVEDLVFADSPILEKNVEEAQIIDVKKLLHKQKASFDVSKMLRTREIMRYWKVAPLYYTVALIVRWVNKAPGPRTIWLGTSRSISRLLTRRDGRRGKSAEDAYKAYISNAEAMQSGWKRTGEIASKGPLKRQIEIFRRSVEIWSYFTSFYLKEKRMLKKFKSGRWTEEQFSAGRSRLGAEVTQNLLKLGPTFIKVCYDFLFSFLVFLPCALTLITLVFYLFQVGQLFSTRIDIVPKEYILELRLLQDQVPPFDGEIAASIIEAELGKPVTELFDSFNKTSLAAASLGQVHLATKGDLTFAVKVQRQYLRELFEVDLGQLRQLAGFADALDFQASGGVMDSNTQRDWVSVYEEMKRLLYEEIDYLNELKNCNLFR